MAIPEGYIPIQCPACKKKFLAKKPDQAREARFTCSACGEKFGIRCGAPAAASTPESPRREPPRPPVAEVKKTVRADNFNPGWTVAMTPAKALLKVTMHRTFLPAKVKAFNLDGLRSWTIGRRDNITPSDISITGDNSISRCCASIEANQSQGGAQYIFRVLKTKNPIFINSRPLASGEAIQLRFGDTITMGKTEMIFTDK
ncbi:MAG: FHA domain-containing protein [Muribaculaceae bacterium]|nr:FHA domain-containing protein [Muribaculaceae bacterium]